MPAIVEPERVDAVFLWRRSELVKLGFNARQASRMAEVLDVRHDAEALLAAGCPPELVFDLLT